MKLEIDQCILTYSTSGAILGSGTINSIAVTYSLLSLEYKKKIYQPGCLEIKLQIKSSAVIHLQDIVNAFKQKKVNYSDDYTDKNNKVDTYFICAKYYIFEVYPQKITSSTRTFSIEVTLVAYSPDKYLTLDKYSKAYTGKKLVQDILIEELQAFDFPDAVVVKDVAYKRIYNTTTKKWEDDTTGKLLKIMNVTTGATVGNLAHLSKDANKERILPYLVQYNESFYDFLVRTANRCGEFLYYEGWTFYLGLPSSTEPANTEPTNTAESDSTETSSTETSSTETNIEPINVHSISVSNLEVSSKINSGFRTYNYCKKKSDTKNQEKEISDYNAMYSSKRSYNPELTDEDYATSFVDSKVIDSEKKGADFKYMGLEQDYLGTRNWVSATWSVLTQPNLFLMAAEGGYSMGMMYAKAKKMVDGNNKKYKERYLTDDEERGFGNYQYGSTGLLTDDTFYTGIFDNERIATNNAIIITMDAYLSYPLLLGSKIKFEDKSYIVVEAEGSIIIDDAKFSRRRKYTAIQSNGYPPVGDHSRIRTSTTQTAFVADNADPLRLNRVRIRFPWQQAKDDTSPWIRVSMPMASADSGFNFIPEVNDEVLVDFENGNVERPYVVGSLYYMDGHKPKDFNRGGGTRSITSRNGHRIIFSDPGSGGAFLDSFFPLSTLVGDLVFINPANDENVKTFGSWADLKKEDQKRLAGGMELTDEYGMYSIKMSSSGRSISIDSPFGKVGINAFTGITINAPNGDIKISGKNVSIEAGNNLTLKSGTNITKGLVFSKPIAKESSGKTIGTDVLNFALKKVITPPIDLGLLRCVLEAVIRPIGGTMLVKSNRYMCLEAGKGTATIASKEGIGGAENTLKNISNAAKNVFLGTEKTSAVHNRTEKDKIHSMLRDLCGFIEALDKACKDNWNELEYRCAEFSKQAHFLRTVNGTDYTQINPYDRKTNLKSLPPLKDPNRPKDIEPTYSQVDLWAVLNGAANEINKKAISMKQIYENTLKSYNQDTREQLTKMNGAARRIVEHDYWTGKVWSTCMTSKAAAAFPAGLQSDKKSLVCLVMSLLDPNVVSVHKYKVDAKWKETCDFFIARMKGENLSSEEFEEAVKTSVYETLFGAFKGFIDQNVWGTSDIGDLLISTEKGKTLHLKGKAVDEYVMNNSYDDWDSIGEQLKNL